MTSQLDCIYYGVTGKILKVNLNNKSISIEKLNQNYLKEFMGGAGYACRYLYDLIEKDTDPLSPENILMIMNGPFSLTSAPSFGRFVLCSKSPYTKLWGESNCGGFFGPELKRAGYDGIIISGRAENPVYLSIFNDKVEILDASNLWGRGIKESRQILKNIQQPNCKTLLIGQAGENLVKFATINADGRSGGRTGMGAIMGSKNLKAIVVKGSSLTPNIANPEKFKRTVKKILGFILNCNTTKILRKFGTSAGVLGAYSFGDLPIKYWSKGEWDKVLNISEEKYAEELYIKNKSCYGCPIGCGRIIKITTSTNQLGDCEGPEYETLAGFGSMILNDNIESIAMANNLCNDYGLDTISTSSVIAFLFQLYNNFKVSQDSIDNLELKWGNSDSMLSLIKKIAFRQGIGNLLAEGSNAVGKKFNISREEIATVNNLEVPYHDLRACYGMALTYAFSPRGACHTTADGFKVLRESNEINYSSIGAYKVELHSNSKDMAEATARLQDYRALYSSLICCFFSNPPPECLVELINNLLDFRINISSLKLMAERIFNLKRLFNIKMGLTSKNDHVPAILLKMLNEGKAAGKTPNFEKLKKHYYYIRDWDAHTGKPNINKLKELGLDALDLP